MVGEEETGNKIYTYVTSEIQTFLHSSYILTLGKSGKKYSNRLRRFVFLRVWK